MTDTNATNAMAKPEALDSTLESQEESKETEALELEMAAMLLEQQDADPKAHFIYTKLNPIDPKEKAKLEQKLALTYSEKLYNTEQLQLAQKQPKPVKKLKNVTLPAVENMQDVPALAPASAPKVKTWPMFEPKPLITRESKIADYTQELSRQFDEQQSLEQEQTQILEQHAKANYQPKVAEKGWRVWETPEQTEARVRARNIEKRRNFIKTHESMVLFEALLDEIKKTPSLMPETQANFEKELKAQTLLMPLYHLRQQARAAELTHLCADKQKARAYEPAPVMPLRQLKNDAPDLGVLIGAHYRAGLLQKELEKPREKIKLDQQKVQERRSLIQQHQADDRAASVVNQHITEARVLDGRVKKFKPMV